MARILAEKTESSFAPSHSFRRCTTYWRGTTISIVQDQAKFCTGSCGSLNLTPSSTIASSHLLIIYADTCDNGDSGCGSLSLSDTASNAWSGPTTVGQAGHGEVYMWYACSSKSGSDTITATQSGSGQSIHMHFYELSGAATSGCLDTTGTNNGSGLTVNATTTASVAQSNEYVSSFFTDWDNNQTFTQGSNSTLQLQTNNSTNGDSAASEINNAQTGLSGQQGASMTHNGSGGDIWLGIIAAFKPALASPIVNDVIVNWSP